MAAEDVAGEDRGLTDRAALSLREANQTDVQPAYRRIAGLAGWLLRRVARHDWGPSDTLPKTGGVIVVANHISNADPVVVAHYLVWNGRWPRFLGKAELWKMPIVRNIVKGTGQIPVQRGGERAAASLAYAEAALEAGECILIYPEGTISTDPDLWPMTGRTGAARLALDTGCPVVPLGQWGAQQLLGAKRVAWPRLIPKPTLTIRLGPPVDLADLVGRDDHDAVHTAALRMMDAITTQVELVRGEKAPVDRFDLRVGKRVPQVRPGQ